ncbi:hypothetical protein HPG69_008311 [Diceros bicornis minor]|uniref:Uncharacterized protein n=1 Tax=Diceros bicornis minor TaxID=77932 RepID=A0A7J7EWW8_DICBM|nr:hypothetical protein HPG69_008311 [Diceros bicornis minor]
MGAGGRPQAPAQWGWGHGPKATQDWRAAVGSWSSVERFRCMDFMLRRNRCWCFGDFRGLGALGWSHGAWCVSSGPAQGAPSQYSSYQQGQGQQYGSYRASQTGPSAQQQRPYGYEQASFLDVSRCADPPCLLKHNEGFFNSHEEQRDELMGFQFSEPVKFLKITSTYVLTLVRHSWLGPVWKLPAVRDKVLVGALWWHIRLGMDGLVAVLMDCDLLVAPRPTQRLHVKRAHFMLGSLTPGRSPAGREGLCGGCPVRTDSGRTPSPVPRGLPRAGRRPRPRTLSHRHAVPCPTRTPWGRVALSPLRPHPWAQTGPAGRQEEGWPSPSPQAVDAGWSGPAAHRPAPRPVALRVGLSPGPRAPEAPWPPRPSLRGRRAPARGPAWRLSARGADPGHLSHMRAGQALRRRGRGRPGRRGQGPGAEPTSEVLPRVPGSDVPFREGESGSGAGGLEGPGTGVGFPGGAGVPGGGGARVLRGLRRALLWGLGATRAVASCARGAPGALRRAAWAQCPRPVLGAASGVSSRLLVWTRAQSSGVCAL